jgi:hypothetical protein
MDGSIPWPGDDIGRLLYDMVTHGADLGMPESAVPGEVIPATRFSGFIDLAVAGLPLPGSPGFSPPPIDWRRVEGDIEFVCSQDAVVKRLVHEMLASIGRNLLHPIWVRLKKEINVCLCASSLL